ncbi:MAG TPA: polysaccharide deacetylase family protein, partial [Chloroflexota bacterium]|nr:polysaccharide deacetylase family protein [Chloroflexota bacterium]
TLGSGDSHPFVATLNARLAELARQGAITFEGPDGDPATYGEATRRAVASFQEAHGLVSTGVLDLPTWEAVQAVQAPPSPPSAPPVAQLEVAVPDGGTPRVRTMAAGGDGQPAVYLTFDDGPHPTYTPQVLDTLARHGVVGTFFVLGQQAERYPDLVRRAASAGHYVANHTYDHHTLQGAGLQQFMHEVQGTRDILVRIAGDVFTLDHDVRYLRPPYGATDGNTRQLAAQLGYSVVLWDIDPQDWRRPGAGQISSHILSHVRPGAIVLMHDGGGDRSQTVAALDTVLSELKNRGYTFRNVFEMSRAQPPAPSPAPGGGAGAGAVVSGTGGQGVNLRASPGLRAPVIKGLPEGAPLTLLGGDASGDGLTWRHVRDAQGAEGWVAAQFVSPR